MIDSALNQYSRFSFLVVAWLCAVAVMVFSYLLPHNGWDLLGHVGGALHFSISDPAEIHRLSYQFAREALRVDVFRELTDGSAHRSVWAADPEAFIQLLPFYEPRVLVTYPAHLVYLAGFNPVYYLQIQSSVAAAVGILLFAFAFVRYAGIGLLGLFPVMLLLAGVLYVARFEGPDALSFCGYALAVLLIMRRSGWALLVLALLPLTRSDMIVYCLPALLYCLCLVDLRRYWVILALACCLITYFTVNHLFDNYGWVKQFYVKMFEYQTHPADVSLSFTFIEYLTAVFRGMILLVYNNQFQAFLIAFAVVFSAFFMNCRNKGILASMQCRMLVLGLLAGLYIVVHYLAFPAMATRYFAGQYLHVMLIAVILMAQWARSYRLDS